MTCMTSMDIHGHQWTHGQAFSEANMQLSSATLSVLATCGNPCNVARIVNFVKHTGFEADEARPVVSCATVSCWYLLYPFVASEVKVETVQSKMD
jgi:hypothetical protein